ncbi:MAG: hypothetical protein KGN00_06150 [Chloroflexota bacterium]|nr:hypothetical protein [Chloroflexota bacterium]MDE3193254.1 hypothetical protein [Chloroflexota bacterium]
MRGMASRAKAHAALLALWMGAGVAVVLYLEPGDARILVPVVAGFTVVVSLWHPIPRAGTVVSLLAAAIYVGMRYLVEGQEGIAQPAVAAAVVLFGLGLVADAFTARAEADALQRRHDSLLIDELTPTSSTGAMKWQHAQKQLAEEIDRARRYKHPVSLVLVGLDPLLENAPDAQVQAALRQRSDLVRFLLAKTRTSDHVAFRGEDRLALVLPHTPLKGALAFVDKYLPDMKVAAGVDPRIGVAEFPTDAGSADELTSEAESALEFGKASGIRVVSRSILMGDQGSSPGRATPPLPRSGAERSANVQGGRGGNSGT